MTFRSFSYPYRPCHNIEQIFSRCCIRLRHKASYFLHGCLPHAPGSLYLPPLFYARPGGTPYPATRSFLSDLLLHSTAYGFSAIYSCARMLPLTPGHLHLSWESPLLCPTTYDRPMTYPAPGGFPLHRTPILALSDLSFPEDGSHARNLHLSGSHHSCFRRLTITP